MLLLEAFALEALLCLGGEAGQAEERCVACRVRCAHVTAMATPSPCMPSLVQHQRALR